MVPRHLLLVVATAGCATESKPEPTRDTSTSAEPRALFIGIDGMRPDALVAAHTPHMDRLRAEGAWSLAAATQSTGATSSAPGWTSIFTGVEVTTHGVEANGEYDHYDRSHPTFAHVARHTLGLPTRAAAHWPEVLSHIHAPDDFDDSVLAGDDAVADTLAADITDGGAHLLVAHLDDADHAGHASGFTVDNPDYIAAIEAQDTRIGRMLAAIDSRPDTEDWLVVVTTDHGGEGTDHGAMNSACQTIPLIVWGGAVSPGELSADLQPSHLDAFPTILTHLGATPEHLGAATGRSHVPSSGG